MQQFMSEIEVGGERQQKEKAGEERANSDEVGRKIQQGSLTSWLQKLREGGRAKGETENLSLGNWGKYGTINSSRFWWKKMKAIGV